MFRAKSLFSTLFLGIFSILVLPAQTLIDQGESFFQEAKFEEAIEVLDKQLETSWIEADQKAKAYYIRGLSKLRLVEAIKLEKISKKEQESREALMISSCYDFVRARGASNEWADLAKTELPALYDSLAFFGFQYFDAIYEEGNSEGDRAIAGAKAKPFFDCLVAIKPSDFVGYGMRARAEIAMVDPLNASLDFERAGQFYKGSLPEIPSPYIGDDFFYAAELQYIYLQETEKALQTVQAGKELLKSEIERLTSLQSEIAADDWEALLSKFEEKLQDLLNMESDIQTANSSVNSAQLEAFEQALELDPGNAVLWIAYADIIQYDQSEKALEAYQKAAEINPKDFNAPFKKGMLHLNLGNDFLLMSTKASASDTTKEWRAMGMSHYKEGLVWLDKAHKLKPQNEEVLDLLIMVCSTLDEKQKLKKYTKLLEEL